MIDNVFFARKTLNIDSEQGVNMEMEVEGEKSYKRPLGVSIIAAISLISGVLAALMFLGLAFIGSVNGRFVIPVIEWPSLINTLNAIAGITGIFYVIASVGLWKLKTWAWYLAVIVALIEIANQLYRVQYGIFWLFWPPVHILSFIVVAYLIVGKKHFRI